MEVLTLHSTISISESRFIGSKIGDELMLMDLNSGNYINLNEVGTVIWEQIQEPKTVSQICEVLLAKFDVKESLCQSTTIDYLQRLANDNYINIS